MSAEKSRRWHTYVRKADGKAVLRAPDGRDFEGTAAEVRAAAMTPERRRMLADGLRVTRLTTGTRTDARAWMVAERRREAIQGAETDAALGLGRDVPLPAALLVLAEAAARATGQTLAEFVAEWVASGIEAARDSGGVPLTRHERAALDRLGAVEG